MMDTEQRIHMHFCERTIEIQDSSLQLHSGGVLCVEVPRESK